MKLAFFGLAIRKSCDIQTVAQIPVRNSKWLTILVS